MSVALLPPQPITAGHIVRQAMQMWDAWRAPAGFPRDPEPFIGLHLPVAVYDFPELSCAGVAAWAARNGLPVVAALPDRSLRGCLLAHRGRAFLLLDRRDPADERRLTLAHELGHFLLEVHEPRRRALKVLGGPALAVLDGERPAGFVERLQIVLGEAPLPAYAHLMTREADGSVGCSRIAAAECAADAFALELLAPRATLAPELRPLAGRPLQQRREAVCRLLRERFGLPECAAEGYGRSLVEELTGGQSARELLGL